MTAQINVRKIQRARTNMDLNHILLFIAFLSPIALIVRSQRAGETQRGWRMASIAVLVVTAGAWILFPRIAGYVGGGAWCALLLLPAIITRKISDLILHERFGAALHLTRLLYLLHPTANVSAQTRFLRAMTMAQSGETNRALDLLVSLRNDTSATGRQACAQTFRLRGDWEGLIAWFRAELLPGALQREPVLPLYFRALGEMGRLDELALQLAARSQTFSGEPSANPARYFSLLALFAFNGSKASLVRLLKNPLRKLSRARKEFWIATGELAASGLERGRTRLLQLQSQRGNALLRSEIQTRLQRATQYAMAASNRDPQTERIVRRFESQQMQPTPYTSAMGRVTPTVLTLIACNVAMFLIEMLLGGSTNPLTLHRLGQLETWNFFPRHEYWRLLTSLFLHYGPLHLLFNIYALYILGPGLERAIGVARFLACYLISGIGSGLGVVLLHVIGLTPPEEVVGASGCIMGVVGAWAGFLLLHRHAPAARRRLQNIAIIVIVQTLFDLSTPQISMTAHLCGLVTGFVVGLILAPRA
jgi:rhomboid protease GluP